MRCDFNPRDGSDHLDGIKSLDPVVLETATTMAWLLCVVSCYHFYTLSLQQNFLDIPWLKTLTPNRLCYHIPQEQSGGYCN